MNGGRRALGGRRARGVYLGAGGVGPWGGAYLVAGGGGGVGRAPRTLPHAAVALRPHRKWVLESESDLLLLNDVELCIPRLWPRAQLQPHWAPVAQWYDGRW